MGLEPHATETIPNSQMPGSTCLKFHPIQHQHDFLQSDNAPEAAPVPGPPGDDGGSPMAFGTDTGGPPAATPLPPPSELNNAIMSPSVMFAMPTVTYPARVESLLDFQFQASTTH